MLKLISLYYKNCNFDVRSCRYAEEAYTAKKWAFVSDYARLMADARSDRV